MRIWPNETKQRISTDYLAVKFFAILMIFFIGYRIHLRFESIIFSLAFVLLLISTLALFWSYLNKLSWFEADRFGLYKMKGQNNCIRTIKFEDVTSINRGPRLWNENYCSYRIMFINESDIPECIWLFPNLKLNTTLWPKHLRSIYPHIKVSNFLWGKFQ